MNKKITILGGIEAGGMGYSYNNDKDYITFKNDKNENLFALDYWVIGKKFYWSIDNEPPYDDFRFEMYNTEEEGLKSKEAIHYLFNGYCLKENTIYRLSTYKEENKSFNDSKSWFSLSEAYEEYIVPANLLKDFLAENVAQDIIDDKGIQLGTEEFKTISYYQEDMKYSIVVAKEGYAIAIETNIKKEDVDAALEMVKGMTTFHVIEGTQIDDKLVGKIEEE